MPTEISRSGTEITCWVFVFTATQLGIFKKIAAPKKIIPPENNAEECTRDAIINEEDEVALVYYFPYAGKPNAGYNPVTTVYEVAKKWCGSLGLPQDQFIRFLRYEPNQDRVILPK